MFLYEKGCFGDPKQTYIKLTMAKARRISFEINDCHCDGHSKDEPHKEVEVTLIPMVCLLEFRGSWL